MTRESEFKLKMPGNFNEDNWRRGRGRARTGAAANGGRSSAMDGETSDGGNFPSPTPDRGEWQFRCSGAASRSWHRQGDGRRETLRPGPALCGQKMAPRGRTTFDQSRARH
jgi:hypothetical protein